MNIPISIFKMIAFSAMVVGVFALNSPATAAEESEATTHDGKVVSLVGDKLVMTSKKDNVVTEHTHMLSPDAKITLDGKTCLADALKAGTKIRVTTKTGEAKVVSHIEAIVKNELFANTHDGKFVSMTANQFVMSDSKGNEHSHTLSKNAKVCCDGKECNASELKAGMKIRVTTKQGDESIAVRIEALSKNPEFASL